jgi:uncharacterized BrkB/YihY/UPF0761 family membrane protein
MPSYLGFYNITVILLHASRYSLQAESLSFLCCCALFPNLAFSLNLITMCQAKMEAELALPVPEGQEPKSVVEVVAKVLTKECPSSTFLKNVGL